MRIKADKAVDIKGRVREIKQFLKKQKNQRQRKEETQNKKQRNQSAAGRNPTRKNSNLS